MSLCDEEEQVERANIVVETDNAPSKIRSTEH
jgi:hypothetical protein